MEKEKINDFVDLKKIRRYLFENKLTGADLSKAIEMSENSTGAKLRGERDFTMKDLRKICIKYGIKASEIMKDEFIQDLQI